MNGSIPSYSASSSHVGSAAAPESRASRWLAWAPNLQFAEKGQPFLCVRIGGIRNYVFSLWPDKFFKFQAAIEDLHAVDCHVVAYLWLFSCAWGPVGSTSLEWLATCFGITTTARRSFWASQEATSIGDSYKATIIGSCSSQGWLGTIEDVKNVAGHLSSTLHGMQASEKWCIWATFEPSHHKNPQK